MRAGSSQNLPCLRSGRAAHACMCCIEALIRAGFFEAQRGTQRLKDAQPGLKGPKEASRDTESNKDAY